MTGQCKDVRWLVLLAVWATFLLYSAIAAPIPGVNEPHYLCKAKHYWQPEWCSADFFLDSPNAHTVFFATIGALTNVFSLDVSAWIGRSIAMLLLAWGWTRGCSRMLFLSWSPLWCAWIFLLINSFGNFSGEWLIGGVEGKVFAYAFLFAAFADVIDRRRNFAALWAGLGISFHPVVGVWGLLAFLGSEFVVLAKDLFRDSRPSPTRPSQGWLSLIAHRLSSAVQPAMILFITSLPGLIPVIELLTAPVSPQVKYEANYYQVYFRLAHHLDPMTFPARSYIGYACLIGFLITGMMWGGRSNARKSFDLIVIWSVIFALVGVVIGYYPVPKHPELMPFFEQRMNLLKFYPFRLADALVPIAVAVALIGVLERTWLYRPSADSERIWLSPAAIMMTLLFGFSLWQARHGIDPNRYAGTDRTDWMDICSWIDQHLPNDALVQSPTNGWAFKWFARRAEYVSFKDCPQNAEGIVEWNRRLNFLHNWYEKKYADKLYSASELRQLRDETKMTHLLTDRLGPLELDPIYRNATFQIYDLRSLGERPAK